MQTYQLIDVEWSDYGDKVEILSTTTAANESDAAIYFRAQGFTYGYIRREGWPILRRL